MPQEEHTYKNVLLRLPQNQKVFFEATTGVEATMSKVANYVGEWVRYQALWDLQPDMLYERLGNDLDKWMKALLEIKKTRASVDTQETRVEIFPVVIDYAKVQSKVSLKYDYWHREVLQKFGSTLGRGVRRDSPLKVTFRQRNAGVLPENIHLARGTRVSESGLKLDRRGGRSHHLRTVLEEAAQVGTRHG